MVRPRCDCREGGACRRVLSPPGEGPYEVFGLLLGFLHLDSTSLGRRRSPSGGGPCGVLGTPSGLTPS
eukprot:81993-Pyramimonas_sp.AAC.1